MFTSVVYQVKDTIFWKQITTASSSFSWLSMLFIKSKIQFSESKSQRYQSRYAEYKCCLSSQRYNFLKANHNVHINWYITNIVVYQVKDTIFWKQITTSLRNLPIVMELFIKSKIQFSESKSQRQVNTLLLNFVVYQVKDTIFWKQITTSSFLFSIWNKLFIKSKIQFSESKSQLKQFSSDFGICCLSSQRYNFLKANHNFDNNRGCSISVVYQVKDTIFWKQITTLELSTTCYVRLFIKSKIQFSESKSQQLIAWSI